MSTSAGAGGRSRTPSCSRAPIGFSPGGPELHRGFVDHRDAIAAPDLRRVEHPAAAQRDAERAQVIGADQVDPDPFRVVWDLSRDRERRLGPPNGRPNVAASTPGSAADPLQQLLRKAVALVERRCTWPAAAARRRSARDPS